MALQLTIEGGCCCPDGFPCCPGFTLPATLTLTFENVSGCANLDGQTVTLNKSGAGDEGCYEGTATIDGCEVNYAVICTSNSNWDLVIGSADCANPPTASAAAITCNPLEILFSSQVEGCCDDGIGSSVDIRITE